MDENELIDDNMGAFENNDETATMGSKIKAVPKPQKNIGVDVDNEFFQALIDAGLANAVDISKFNSFLNVSQQRDQIYAMLDTMAEDSTVAAVIETYAEDATEYNDQGKIVWAESADSNVAKYITFLLDTINVDKHVYKWAYSLCKYGDLYLRLYRESEFNDPIFSEKNQEYASSVGSGKESLNEDIVVKAYAPSDNFVHYLEMYPNPAEIFELTRFGKSCGYIKADVGLSTSQVMNKDLQGSIYQYSFNKKDVEIYGATEYVHASLDDNTSRTPEKVDLFITDDVNSKTSTYSYTVRRGQSLLYNVFKIWRELMLLENSVLLNRITKSSIVRVIGVEVGDMPKEMVGPHLQGVKSLIEQKVALNDGKYMSEYTNPGPIENNVYVPTRNGIGALSTQQIGGDVDVKSLADLDYFKNKFFGCLDASTKIVLSDGSICTIEEMFSNKNEYIGKEIKACNSNGDVYDTTISDVYCTGKKKNFIEFTLENGKIIRVTPEHRMMLKDGTFKQACELTEEDELMDA